MYFLTSRNFTFYPSRPIKFLRFSCSKPNILSIFSSTTHHQALRFTQMFHVKHLLLFYHSISNKIFTPPLHFHHHNTSHTFSLHLFLFHVEHNHHPITCRNTNISPSFLHSLTSSPSEHKVKTFPTSPSNFSSRCFT